MKEEKDAFRHYSTSSSRKALLSPLFPDKKIKQEQESPEIPSRLKSLPKI